jgi:hypothetical protein
MGNSPDKGAARLDRCGLGLKSGMRAWRAFSAAGPPITIRLVSPPAVRRLVDHR